jgi:hypothetical protein
MELITGWSWACYLLPALLIVAWPLLWWRGSRRIRLWWAGLTPLGAYAGFFLGLLENSWERSQAGPVSCPTSDCDMWGHFAASVDSTSMLGWVIMINSVLGFAVAVALGLLTVVVELVLLGVRARSRTTLRRSEEAPPSADS